MTEINQYLNLKKASKDFGFDMKFMQQLKRNFVADNKNVVSYIDAAYANQEYSKIVKICHKLKSATGFLCAESLRRASLELEKTAGLKNVDKNLDKVIAKIDKFKKVFNHTIAAMQDS